MLPAFKPIPQEIIPFMDLPECNEPKAVCLPESLGAKLILIAVDEQPHLYSLWLYSLDDDFRPIDKLCLYAIEDKSDEIDPEDTFVRLFPNKEKDQLRRDLLY